jgi:hypothetical protein
MSSRRSVRWLRISIPVVLAAIFATPTTALRVETLTSIGSLPPHIVGEFEDPVQFQQSESGTYYVLDRRAQRVYSVDAARKGVTTTVKIGQESGLVLQPFGFDLGPGGSFVVGDVPRGAQQRVQTFTASGAWQTGFFLPGEPVARVEFGNLALNGIGSLRFVDGRLLISHPESGALFTEYSTRGYAQRSVGTLRKTGFEDERDLHIAMNAGLALPDPTGGFYFVFVTGTPMFRKYDAAGTLRYERYIQGPEIDTLMSTQPTRWPRRRVNEREVPLVRPVIRTAAVDRTGHLWISLATPLTYVFDAQGDKVRTIQFVGAGPLSPTSMFFTRENRLLVTPGCYEFDPRPASPKPEAKAGD